MLEVKVLEVDFARIPAPLRSSSQRVGSVPTGLTCLAEHIKGHKILGSCDKADPQAHSIAPILEPGKGKSADPRLPAHSTQTPPRRLGRTS